MCTDVTNGHWWQEKTARGEREWGGDLLTLRVVRTPPANQNIKTDAERFSQSHQPHYVTLKQGGWIKDS